MLKSLFLFTALAAFPSVFGQQKAQLPDKKKLIGHWVSTGDSNYHIAFTPTLQRAYYGNEIQATNSYRLHHDTLVTRDKQTGSVFRYSVVSLSNTNLTLLYLDRGNLL